MGSITLGSIFNHGVTATAFFALLSIAVFGVAGLWLAISGIADMAAATRRQQGSPGGFGWVGKLIGSGLCFAIPQAAGVSWTQLFTTSSPMQQIGQQASGVSAPTNCLASQSSGANPVACVMSNLASDTAPAFDILVMSVAAVAGLWMIYKFIRSVIDKGAGGQQAGVRWGYLVVGIIFLGVGAVIHIIGNSLGFPGTSLGNSGYASTAAYLAYVPSSLGLSPQYQQMVAAGYVILAAVGFYEVVHGGFLLASALNPNGQYGIGGRAAVHIIFGVLLVFLPLFLQAVYSSGFGASLS